MKIILAVALVLAFNVCGADDAWWKDAFKEAIVELKNDKDIEKTWDRLSKLTEFCDTENEVMALLDDQMNKDLDAAIDAVVLRGGILKYKGESCRKALTDYRAKVATRLRQQREAELAARSK